MKCRATYGRRSRSRSRSRSRGVQGRRVGGPHAVQDQGRVGALVLESGGRRFQGRGPPGGYGRDARRHAERDQDARGDEHRQRGVRPGRTGGPASSAGCAACRTRSPPSPRSPRPPCRGPPPAGRRGRRRRRPRTGAPAPAARHPDNPQPCPKRAKVNVSRLSVATHCFREKGYLSRKRRAAHLVNLHNRSGWWISLTILTLPPMNFTKIVFVPDHRVAASGTSYTQGPDTSRTSERHGRRKTRRTPGRVNSDRRQK
jgi:hypothetical protein